MDGQTLPVNGTFFQPYFKQKQILKKIGFGSAPPRLTLENVQALAKKVPQTVWIWLPPPFLEKVQARAEKSSLKFLIWV